MDKETFKKRSEESPQDAVTKKAKVSVLECKRDVGREAWEVFDDYLINEILTNGTPFTRKEFKKRVMKDTPSYEDGTKTDLLMNLSGMFHREHNQDYLSPTIMKEFKDSLPAPLAAWLFRKHEVVAIERAYHYSLNPTDHWALEKLIDPFFFGMCRRLYCLQGKQSEVENLCPEVNLGTKLPVCFNIIVKKVSEGRPWDDIFSMAAFDGYDSESCMGIIVHMKEAARTYFKTLATKTTKYLKLSSFKGLEWRSDGCSIDYDEYYEGTCCLVCGHDNDHSNMLLCECCDDEYHWSCLTPPLTGVPENEWYCHLCIEQQKKSSGLEI